MKYLELLDNVKASNGAANSANSWLIGCFSFESRKIIYSRISVARTLMARLPRLFRTRS